MITHKFDGQVTRHPRYLAFRRDGGWMKVGDDYLAQPTKTCGKPWKLPLENQWFSLSELDKNLV